MHADRLEKDGSRSRSVEFDEEDGLVGAEGEGSVDDGDGLAVAEGDGHEVGVGVFGFVGGEVGALV